MSLTWLQKRDTLFARIEDHGGHLRSLRDPGRREAPGQPARVAAEGRTQQDVLRELVEAYLSIPVSDPEARTALAGASGIPMRKLTDISFDAA